MSTGPDQSAQLKFVVTNTLILRDIHSVAFYREVLEARTDISLRSNERP
jgi:hypothetical protein